MNKKTQIIVSIYFSLTLVVAPIVGMFTANIPSYAAQQIGQWALSEFLNGIAEKVNSLSDLYDERLDTATSWTDDDGNVWHWNDGDPYMEEPTLDYYGTSTSNSGTLTGDTNNYTYNNYNYHSGDTVNRSLSYVTNNTNYTYNPTTNTYFNSTNNWVTVNDNEYNTYYNYDTTNNYYYATYNNYNYQTIVTIPVSSPDVINVYTYFYQLPDGSNSYNLTQNDVLGLYFSYDTYNYGVAMEPNSSLLGLWHFNGSYTNEVPDSPVKFNYNSTSFISGKYDSALQTNSTSQNGFIVDNPDVSGNGIPTSYTVEYYFKNSGNNNALTDIDCGSGGQWSYFVLTYDGDTGTTKEWINGVEVTKATNSTRYLHAGYEYYLGSNSKTTTVTVNSIDYTYSVNANSSSYSVTVPSSYYTKKSYTITHTPTISWTATPSSFTVQNGSGSNVSMGFSKTSGTDTLSKYTKTISSGLHYYPLCDDTGVEFGYWGGTDTHTDGLVKGTYYYHHPMPWIGLNISTYSRTAYYYTSSVNKSGTSNLTFTTDLGKNWLDSSNCAIDECRFSSGLLYTSDDPPSSGTLEPFEAGYIYTAPTGSDFKVGDIAVQNTTTITSLRVGGSAYSYPVQGNCYIGIDGTVGSYCKIYDGGVWIYCPFSVWNGSEWVDGTTFDFSTQTFGSKSESTTSTTTIINNFNQQITNIFGDGDDEVQSVSDFINVLPTILSLVLTTVTGLITFAPTWFFGAIGSLFTVLTSVIIYKFIRG